MTEISLIDPEDDDDLALFARLVNEVAPDIPTSVEDLHWENQVGPGITRFRAMRDGRPVAVASVGRLFIYEPSHPRYWVGMWVLPEARRQGLGGRLLLEASRVARAAGKTGFQTDVSEARPEALAFLARRGFEEFERTKLVALDLRGLTPAPVEPPDGIELTSLADRPDLLPGLYEVALDGYPDIPSIDEPVTVGEFDEFVARDIRRAGVPPEALAIGVDPATGRVAGWGSLLYAPGSTTVAWHDMTVVARAYRGRGLATALKRSVIRWAIQHGVEQLRTGNDEKNAPMRAVNRRLGYAPLPDLVTLRGPLVPED